MAIMDFCGNVKAHENLNTLSDERNNSPDEMEARFARVMKGVLMAAAHLVCMGNYNPILGIYYWRKPVC